MDRVVLWFQQPFRLLDSYKSRWQLIIFCGVFGCVFLNVFHPFNMDEWFKNVHAPLFVILSFFPLAGMAALVLSQFAFRSWFKAKLATRMSFFGWLIVEFFIISIAIHTVNITLLELPFVNIPEYLVTVKYTLLLLVLPYCFGILLLFIQDQLVVVKELTIKANQSSATDENVIITDENGKAVVRLPVRNILYFKSEDNYVLLFYKNEHDVKKELIRNNLKKLEKDLDLPNFMRIHRSYMINTQNLASVLRTSQGYRIKMNGGADHELSVSATYQRNFEDRVVQKAS